MKSKFLWWALGIVGIVFLLSSLTITIVEYQRFKTKTSTFPEGSTIAGVPVGGLDAAGAEARISEYYAMPVTLHIDGASIQVLPAELGFSMDIPGLVVEGLEQIRGAGYWASLWNRTNTSPVNVPLEAAVDRAQIMAYLTTEITPRYTQSGSSVSPIPNTTNFDLSSSGSRVDPEKAAANIEAALRSPEVRDADVPVTFESGGAASFETLATFLRHNIDWVGFDGLVKSI